MDDLEVQTRLVEEVLAMTDDELRRRGATPLRISQEPAEGWPDWCGQLFAAEPPQSVQNIVDSTAVLMAMSYAKQMGFVDGGPDVNFRRAPVLLAYARTRGVVPQTDRKTIRTILVDQVREAARRAPGR